MAAARRISTTVLPGGKVAVEIPEFKAGQKVDVLVIPQATESDRKSFHQLLKSLPSRRSPAEWEAFEKDFQAERDAWDR
jgi:hypothetical protein